jgi:hypothetical protein
MAFVRYIGKKKKFGPLKKKWMNEPVTFSMFGISTEMDQETADAILRSMPELFEPCDKPEHLKKPKPKKNRLIQKEKKPVATKTKGLQTKKEKKLSRKKK